MIGILLGLVVFAKNEYIQECLVKQMKAHIFYKEYIGIIEGCFNQKNGIIDLPIARKNGSIIERCVDSAGDKSITKYEILKSTSEYSVIKFILQTGRTHQIRVHCSYLKHPLLGDTLYGNASNLISRQALHCYNIKFSHPITKKMVDYIAEIPHDLSNLISIKK